MEGAGLRQRFHFKLLLKSAGKQDPNILLKLTSVLLCKSPRQIEKC